MFITMCKNDRLNEHKIIKIEVSRQHHYGPYPPFSPLISLIILLSFYIPYKPSFLVRVGRQYCRRTLKNRVTKIQLHPA
jgi:hypothetical protein